MSETVVAAKGLVAGYGDVSVVRNLDLEVTAGEVVLLLGANGAGKTTTLRTIAGLLPALTGDINVCGAPVSPERAHTMRRRGFSYVPDDRNLVSGLSVRENLRVAAVRGGMSLDEALDYFPSLRQRARLKAGSLSGGEQQMLAIVRALMNRPKALIIDEMSTGLAPLLVQHLMAAITDVAKQHGTGVLLVEQHVTLALEVADRAYVLVHGELSLHAPAAELRRSPERLASAYLGLTTVPAI